MSQDYKRAYDHAGVEIIKLREQLAAKDGEIEDLFTARTEVREKNVELQLERDTWKARAEKAEADTRRLDFLEKLGFSTIRNGRGEGPKDDPGVHSWRDGKVWRWTAAWIGSEYADVRTAIDAAIAALDVSQAQRK